MHVMSNMKYELNPWVKRGSQKRIILECLTDHFVIIIERTSGSHSTGPLHSDDAWDFYTNGSKTVAGLIPEVS